MYTVQSSGQSWRLKRQNLLSWPRRRVTVAVHAMEEIWVPLEGDRCRVSSTVQCGVLISKDEVTLWVSLSTEPFEEATYALKIGELSQPIYTNSGIHLVLRTA